MASRVVALTGAGVSAESGLATFRGPGGHWRNHRPEDLATPQAFARDPLLVWEWYAERRARAAAALPNPAHRALARLEQSRPAGDFTLVTQNVDGLHHRAGSADPIELHGSLWVVRCTACRRERRDERVPLVPLPPRCPVCGALERPAIVWFGETLPETALARAFAAVDAAGALLVVGTSGLVYPAAGLIERAVARGAVTIEVNPEATPHSDTVRFALRGSAGTILPALVDGAGAA
jgi:NAD-dependent deacetylase